MSGSLPDNEWVEESPVSRDTFDGCDQFSFDSSAPTVPKILVILSEPLGNLGYLEGRQSYPCYRHCPV